MPVATTLSRIGRFDFFAILAPGFYLVAVATVFASAWMSGVNQDAGGALRSLSEQLQSHWPLSVALFFFSYLVGSILRAIPVAFSDRRCGRLFKRDDLPDYERTMYEGDFPYPALLHLQLDALKANGLVPEMTLPVGNTAHPLFNLWKLQLCKRCPAVFAYTQELEGRTRLFSGMIWAFVSNGLLGLLGTILTLFGVFHLSWLSLMAVMTVVSAGFAALLGWRLRHVRAEEVNAVFFGIVNLHL